MPAPVLASHASLQVNVATVIQFQLPGSSARASGFRSDQARASASATKAGESTWISGQRSAPQAAHCGGAGNEGSGHSNVPWNLDGKGTRQGRFLR